MAGDMQVAAPARHTPQMTGECNFGLHQHCCGASFYGGNGGANLLEMWSMELPCQCECLMRHERSAGDGG